MVRGICAIETLEFRFPNCFLGVFLYEVSFWKFKFSESQEGWKADHDMARFRSWTICGHKFYLQPHFCSTLSRERERERVCFITTESYDAKTDFIHFFCTISTNKISIHQREHYSALRENLMNEMIRVFQSEK